MKRMLGAALILGCSAATGAQSGVRFVPPIPSYEQFVHGTNLRIRLTMRKTSLTTADDPGFAADFENTGNDPLYLNPHVVSNVRVFNERGELMQPSCVVISESSGAATVQRSELVRLAAGENWVKPLTPEFAAGGPDSSKSYRGCGSELDGLLLPAGRYTARFTYLSYAGYAAGYIPGQAAGYDLRESTDVWEGRLESESVAFTVAPSETEAAPLARPVSPAAADNRWPQWSGDFRIDCAKKQPAWWFADNPVFATGRCGTAGDFGRLRAMLDSQDEDVRFAAESALRDLTFVGEEGSPELWAPTSTAAWDAWYRDHRHESRADWAARRLADTAAYPLQREAARYLGELKDRRWLAALRAAAEAHPSAWARVTAARAVAQFERAGAIALLTRELGHRDLWICVAALAALNELTGQSLVFDFRLPAERKRAIEAFAANSDAIN